MSNNPSLERTLLAEQLDHYRLQRHDFLNHWQVIAGYLQLGKPERALLYLKEGISGLEAEQQVGQIPQEIVGAILLGFVIGLRKEDLLVEIQLSSPLKKADFWQEFWQEEYGEVLYGYTNRCLAAILARCQGLEEPIIEIRWVDTDGLRCYCSLSDGDQVVWEDCLSLSSSK